MKNLKSVVFTLVMAAVLSSCSTGQTLDWKRVKNNGTGISLESGKVASCNLNFDKAGFDSAKEKADQAAINKSNIYTFNGETEKVLDKVSSLREKLTVANAKYYASGSAEDKAKYDELYEVYLSFYTWYYQFLKHVNESSPEIRLSFFGDMSEAEIAKYIKEFIYTDETKQLDQEISDIQNEQEEMYNAFVDGYRNQSIRMGDAKWNKYLNDSLDNFRAVMEKGGQYAEIYGYANYLDYVYDNYYHRNYRSDFVESYAELVDKYVLPAIRYFENDVSDAVLKKPTKKKIFQNFTSGNIANETYFWGDLVDSYVATIGGQMEQSYKHLKNDGYFLFSNNKNSLGTAYVSSNMDEPLIFFSSDYQTASTFIHEFGHYNAAYSNDNNGSFPFDIEETHSQGNEMLFNHYLSEYYKDDENLDVFKYIQNYQVYNMLDTTLLPCAVAKVENYIFKNLDKSNAEILNGVNSIMTTYRGYYGDGYDMIYAYWAAPAVSATGYYISYSTSAVASVAIYLQAKENFATAVENYKKFVAYPSEEQDIAKFFDYSGLYSPLSEETFRKFTGENLYV